jgi:hypothetical protein
MRWDVDIRVKRLVRAYSRLKLSSAMGSVVVCEPAPELPLFAISHKPILAFLLNEYCCTVHNIALCCLASSPAVTAAQA